MEPYNGSIWFYMVLYGSMPVCSCFFLHSQISFSIASSRHRTIAYHSSANCFIYFLLMRCAGHHSQSICKRSCGSCSRGGIDPSTCHQHLWGKLKETTANMSKNAYVGGIICTCTRAFMHTHRLINSEGPSQDVNHVSLSTVGMTHLAGRGRSHQKASQGCGQMQPTLFGLLVY